MKISEVTEIEEIATNLSRMAYQSSKKKDINLRPFVYLPISKSDVENKLRNEAQRHNLNLEDVFFYPPNWKKDAQGKVVYLPVDSEESNTYQGFYETSQKAQTAYKNVVATIRQKIPNIILKAVNEQRNAKAFMVAYFQPRDKTSRPLALFRWVKTPILNVDRNNRKINAWNWSPDTAKEQGLYSENPVSISENLPLKPGNIMPTGVELTAEQALQTLKQNNDVQTYFEKNLIDNFQKLSSFPWNAGAMSNQGLYFSFRKYFCENLHPISLIKSTSLNMTGLDDLKEISTELFGSPDAYRKTKIVFPPSGSEGLYDSKLVYGNKEILLSSKSGLGNPPNINTFVKRLTPEMEKELNNKYGKEYVDLFKLVGNAGADRNESGRSETEHLIDIAQKLGIITDPGEMAAAKQFWKDGTNGKSNINQLSKFPRLKELAQKEPKSTHKSKKGKGPHFDLFINLLRDLVDPKIQQITQLQDISRYILEKSKFVVMRTTTKPDKFSEGEPVLVTFEIKVAQKIKPKLVHGYDPISPGTIYSVSLA